MNYIFDIMDKQKRKNIVFAVIVILFYVFFITDYSCAAGKIKLNKTKVSLTVGSNIQLKVKNTPRKASIKWSTNKKSVATVSKKGVVSAKKKGNAKITAKVKGKKYVCKVTVKDKNNNHTSNVTNMNNTVTPPVNTTPANNNQNNNTQTSSNLNKKSADANSEIENEDNNKEEYNLTGYLKTIDGNIVKEKIELCFALKKDYYSEEGCEIEECKIDKETGLYKINLPIGEYVVYLRDSWDYAIGLYSDENGIVGEVNITGEKTNKDFVFNGYYITGKWTRNEKPIDENIIVKVVFTSLENKYRNFTNTKFKIVPNEDGSFYFLSDAFYAKSESEINHSVSLMFYGANTNYKISEIGAIDKDKFDISINNSYFVVKGKVTNHGGIHIYDFYDSALGQLRRWNEDEEYYEYISEDEAVFSFADNYGRTHAGDYQFVMAVPKGKYILDMGAVNSSNEITVEGDIEYTSFDFDAYKVELKPNYTGEAGDSIEIGEDKAIYVYEKDKKSNSLKSFYGDYEESGEQYILYLSPGEYDICMRLKGIGYKDKYITGFKVEDKDIEVPFNY